MKKGLLVLLILVLGIIVFNQQSNTPRASIIVPQPEEAPFLPSTKYDGRWEGKRIDVSGDNLCLQTRILGTIKNGAVSLTLMYNNTILSGWINEDGELDLYSDNPRWGYRFEGKAINNRIDGSWKVTNAVCNGSWFVKATKNEM